MSDTVVITGAFSYTGRYATRILLERGYRVRTLTNHAPNVAQGKRETSQVSQKRRDVGHPISNALASQARQPRVDPFGGRVEVFPYNFERPDELRRSLEGASALINTYWVRFPHGGTTFETAVGNSRTLIQAANDAGVPRIVHVSIANPSVESRLGYYRGKALVEQAVRESGMSYAIVRPTVVFGAEDILINNIAWFARRFPVFAIPGDGWYEVRPIYVGDMAQLLVDSARGTRNTVVDAVGPEAFTFEELVRVIAGRVGRRVRIVHVPAAVAYAATKVAGWMVGDVVLTWEEYLGLMENLLASDGAAVGDVLLSNWLAGNAESVGRKYASEVRRHFDRGGAESAPCLLGGEGGVSAQTGQGAQTQGPSTPHRSF